jgi:sec-independent protein translocase protein TatB
MLDMSWGEIMVIGGVALIVIGPKDLPKALRTLGQMTTKMRRLAGEFQSQFNDAMREAELDDVRKEVEALNRQVASSTSTAFNPIQTIRDELKGAVEGKTLPAVTSDTAGSTPVAEISSPETAIATAAANSAADHAAHPAPEAAVEEVGAPPALVAGLPPEPHASTLPDTPLELTGPGLEPAEEPELPPRAARHGAATPHEDHA